MSNIFLEKLEQTNNETTTQNGAKTFKGTLDSNLDLFSKNLRYLDASEVISKFTSAVSEDSELAIKNLLYLLDIRDGKGERKVSKLLIREALLSSNITKEIKDKILKSIPQYGRWDYLIDLIVDEEVMRDKELKETLTNVITFDGMDSEDLLFWKWMPSTRGARKNVAKAMIKFINENVENKINEKDYRLVLTENRAKLKLIETLLTEKRYDEIEFSKVPSKALIKYGKAFNRVAKENLDEYISKVNSGEEKINANNLQAHEIISKFGNFPLGDRWGSGIRIPEDEALLNTMWNNQTNFVSGDHSAIVVADTSASMDGTPICAALGLALYFAERNKGAWENAFITFSREANFVKLPQGKIQDKLKVIPSIVENTNINSVFDLVLKTALTSEEAKQSMPEYIIIVSDMEFDTGTDGLTNFEEWKENFSNNGLTLPKVIFWNASQYGKQSSPVVKNTENVGMVSGFSPVVFKNLFTLEELEPQKLMIDTLSKYDPFFE